MKIHAFHINWLGWRNGEAIALLGFATGRVSYSPQSKYLYSFRLFLLLFKIEVLWITGIHRP